MEGLQPAPMIGPKLAAALIAAMQSVRPAEKSGKNSFHKYAYLTDEDLIGAVRPALIGYGLTIVPIGVDRTDTKGEPDRKGKTQTLTGLVMTYLVVHESGECLQVRIPASGIDDQDKGVYKALTGALKYLLRQMFLVSTQQDPENDNTPKEAAQRAYRAGGEDLARALLHQPITGSYTPGGFQRQLDAVKAPHLVEVCLFCLWSRRPLPQAMEPSIRDQFPGWLVGPEGQNELAAFRAAHQPRKA